MTRNEAMDWLHEHAEALVPGHWLDTSEWATDSAHDEAQVTLFCREHGRRAARLLNRLRGWRLDRWGCEEDGSAPRMERVHATECWAGDDLLQYCDAPGCGVPLNTGGLTRSGIDEYLGDVEEGSAAADATYLLACAGSLAVVDEERWARLIAIVERLAAKPLRFCAECQAVPPDDHRRSCSYYVATPAEVAAELRAEERAEHRAHMAEERADRRGEPR